MLIVEHSFELPMFVWCTGCNENDMYRSTQFCATLYMNVTIWLSW